MPTSITATADAGTDVVTATAHGLLTGDRFRMRNVGGALPAATPSIDPVTTYFAIRLGTDTLKVATSSANALAGTAIDITGAGTGTHYLEYGLPYCEPRVATALSQIKSEDDNATWSSLTALHALLTGQSQSVWSEVMINVPMASLLNLAAGAQFTAGPLIVQGVLSPAALSAGNNNNYNPTGLDDAIVVRLTPVPGSFLTGIAAPSVAGRTITIFNLGTDDLTVTHEDGSSTAENRILLPNATASVVVRDNGSMTLWYDGTSSRWRVWSQNL